jgi:hypothetical protein
MSSEYWGVHLIDRRRFLRYAGAAAFTAGALLVGPQGSLGTANAQSTAKGPVQAESYLVYTDGSTWYASNGATGAIDYSNSDAATVIQKAIDSLGSTWSSGQGGGTVVVRDKVSSLTSSMTMRSHVQLKFLSSVLVVGDIDGFVFDAVSDSSLEIPYLSVWTPSTFTHAAIKLTGALCTKNAVSVNSIYLPTTGYGLHIVAASGHSVYQNKIDIGLIEYGDCGVRVETSSDGWADVNKFHFVSIRAASYGFSLTQNGSWFSGNIFDFCWTEIDNTNHLSAFYFEGSAGQLNHNTFISCKGIDYGVTDSYFIKLGNLSGCNMSGNVYLGCEGGDYLASRTPFLNDIWIDYGNGIQTYAKSNGSTLPTFTGTVLTPTLAPQSPVEGQIYYDSTLHALKVYTGSGWETFVGIGRRS